MNYGAGFSIFSTVQLRCDAMRLTKCIEWLQHYQSEGLYSYTVDYNEDSVENLVTWHITDSNAATLFALKFKQ